jgi:hypothetical protein
MSVSPSVVVDGSVEEGEGVVDSSSSCIATGFAAAYEDETSFAIVAGAGTGVWPGGEDEG